MNLILKNRPSNVKYAVISQHGPNGWWLQVGLKDKETESRPNLKKLEDAKRYFSEMFGDGRNDWEWVISKL